MSEPGDRGADSVDTVASGIYEHRFPEAESRQREALWQVLTAYLQRYVPTSSTILDIGAGNGEFITNVHARERWASDIRDTSDRLGSGIRFVRSDGLSLLEAVPAASFDRIFMSNYLEHLPSGEAVIEQLRVAARLLRAGGQVIILQPNIALVGPAYWDFIDHKVALTEKSLAEAVELAGLRPVLTIKRFLPYTTKGRIPVSAALVRLYLAVRPAWWLMGKQTLMIAEVASDRP